MITLEGITINKAFLQLKEEIGSLLFQEFSSTKLFINENDNIIVREWVDCSDDGEIDRFFYFFTNNFFLSMFVKREISHLDFIKSAIDGIAYFQDISTNESSNFNILAVNKIPSDYLPSINFYAKETDFVNLQEIVSRFQLEKIDTATNILKTVTDFTINNRTDIYNLHINKGKGVGFGKIDTEVLGKALLSFEDLYENVALDVYLGQERGFVNFKKQEQKDIELYTKSEVVGTLAASFSVLIKPTFTEYTLFEKSTSSEVIAKRTFELINNSLDSDLFSEEYKKHSELTINAYKGFLQEIYTLGIDLDLTYISDKSKDYFTQKFNLVTTNKIINEIGNLKISESEEFKIFGKFRALNCDTGHFVFMSSDEISYNGYLDKLIRENSTLISFSKIYQVSIIRKIIKEAIREEPKIEDVIIAYYEEK